MKITSSKPLDSFMSLLKKSFIVILANSHDDVRVGHNKQSKPQIVISAQDRNHDRGQQGWLGVRPFLELNTTKPGWMVFILVFLLIFDDGTHTIP